MEMAYASGRATNALADGSLALAGVSISKCPTVAPSEAHRHSLEASLSLTTGHASISLLSSTTSSMANPVLHTHLVNAPQLSPSVGVQLKNYRRSAAVWLRNLLSEKIRVQLAFRVRGRGVKTPFACLHAARRVLDLRPGSADPTLSEACLALRLCMADASCLSPACLVSVSRAMWTAGSGGNPSTYSSHNEAPCSIEQSSARWTRSRAAARWNFHVARGAHCCISNLVGALFGSGREVPSDPTCFATTWQPTRIPRSPASHPLPRCCSSRFLLRSFRISE
jgi:hypothetical protein